MRADLNRERAEAHHASIQFGSRSLTPRVSRSCLHRQPWITLQDTLDQSRSLTRLPPHRGVAYPIAQWAAIRGLCARDRPGNADKLRLKLL